MGDDGIPYIVAEKNGTYGDYYITVTATHAGINYKMTIKIIGGILPADIKINAYTISGSDCRKFYVCSQMADAAPMFRNSVYDENNNNALRDGFVLQEANQ